MAPGSKNKGKIVKELWWKEDNLHVIDGNGKHWEFKGAYATNYDSGIASNDVMTVSANMNYDGMVEKKSYKKK